MRGKGEGEETERRVDEEEGLFNADTVNEEDSERELEREDCKGLVSQTGRMQGEETHSRLVVGFVITVSNFPRSTSSALIKKRTKITQKLCIENTTLSPLRNLVVCCTALCACVSACVVHPGTRASVFLACAARP